MSEEITIQICNKINEIKSIETPIIVLLVANLAAIVGKFCFDLILKNRDINIHKKNLVAARRIDVLEKLFQSMEELSIFSNDENEALLLRVQDCEKYFNQHRLYLDKKIRNICEEIFDYFKGICSDYKQKNYEQEIKLFDEYAKFFTK